MKIPNVLLFPALFVGSLVFFMLVLYKPAMEEIRKLQIAIRSGQNRGHEEKIIARALEEKSFEVERLRADVGRLRAGLLLPGEENLLMNELRRLSNRLGFQNESIATHGREQRESFDVALFNVNLSGAFEATYRFIQGLEELSYAVLIDRLDIQGGASNEDPIKVEMTLSAPMITPMEEI